MLALRGENLSRVLELLFTTEARGIGLALSKRIAEAHGGSIKVESQVGQGTTFTVSMPVYRGER
jgi:signal transduction histidine kinase